MSAQVIRAVLHRALLGFLTDFTIRGTRGSLEFAIIAHSQYKRCDVFQHTGWRNYVTINITVVM
jgi:hypothetical protein